MWKEVLRIALGLAILGLVAYFLYRGGKSAYFALFPPASSASLSLSAFFEEAPGRPTLFSITGEAQRGGKAINGKAKIGIEKVRGNFRQTFMLELKDGKFAASGLPGFVWLGKCDRIHVIADVWSPDLTAGPLSEELILNAGTPARPKSMLYSAVWIAAFSLLATFVFVFTGNRTSGKNRVAIILSYCMIIIFLAIPLLAPFVFVRTFPDVMEAMKESPVGLVITRPEKQEQGRGENQEQARGENQEQAQWVLNIGGHVKTLEPHCEEPAPRPSGRLDEGGQSNIGPLTRQEVKGPAGRSATLSSTQPQPSGSNPPGKTSVSPGPSEEKNLQPAQTESGVVELEGGLAIPLYVLLLSIIGGAINMTRKLPRIQRDVEEWEMRMPSFRDIARVTVEMVKGTAAPFSGGSVPAEPSAVGAEASPGVGSQETSPAAGHVGKDVEQVPPNHQMEARSDWRTNLLDQYMYLLSAPFLAMATYYLLHWLDLDRVPALVLVSFSVGLISDRVLSAITGSAESIIGGSTVAKGKAGTVKGET